jgi:hypothetical protein
MRKFRLSDNVEDALGVVILFAIVYVMLSL